MKSQKDTPAKKRAEPVMAKTEHPGSSNYLKYHNTEIDDFTVTIKVRRLGDMNRRDYRISAELNHEEHRRIVKNRYTSKPIFKFLRPGNKVEKQIYNVLKEATSDMKKQIDKEEYVEDIELSDEKIKKIVKDIFS